MTSGARSESSFFFFVFLSCCSEVRLRVCNCLSDLHDSACMHVICEVVRFGQGDTLQLEGGGEIPMRQLTIVALSLPQRTTQTVQLLRIR